MLELLILAVHWCSLPLPLSAVKGYAASAYYYGTAEPFITIYWYGNRYSNWYSSKNGRTGYLQPLAAGGTATFTAIIEKMIGCLNRILDKVNNSYNRTITGSQAMFPGIKSHAEAALTQLAEYLRILLEALY